MLFQSFLEIVSVPVHSPGSQAFAPLALVLPARYAVRRVDVGNWISVYRIYSNKHRPRSSATHGVEKLISVALEKAMHLRSGAYSSISIR